MTTVASRQASTTQAAVEARNPKPTIEITSPADGDSRSGVIPVTATASVVGPQADHPDSMQLYVNDTDNPVPGQKVLCTAGGPTCDASFVWDSSGQAGPFLLIVGVHTARNKTNAAAVTVHVTSPAPTVTISEPVENGTVFGSVTVKAAGTVDASQTDGGGSMALYVDNVLKDSVGCPAGRSCPATLTWDASGVNGNRTLKVVYTTGTGRTAADIRHVRVTTTPPTAGISSPVNGGTVSGPVTVVTNGAINARQSDVPASLQLLVDGTAVAPAQACPAAPETPKACSVPFVWDATGLTGTHTLQASFRTQKGFSALSAISTVTVVSPAPAVRVVSPTAGLTVHRTATIRATGAIDASQNDTPSSMRLTLDGAPLGGPIPCASVPAAPKTCAVSYTWGTVGLTGRHTLAATLVSTRGASGTSTASVVYVYGGTKLVFAPAKAQRAGRPVTYTGRVTTLINRLGTPGVKVKVVIRPARGRAKSLSVLTNALGYFKVAFKPAMNTTVEATLAPVAYYGTSHSFAKLKVVPTFRCAVGRSVQRGRLDQGLCRVANLPATTKVSLQYQFAGRWYSLGAGKARGPVIPFSFRFAHGGIFHVRVVLSATSVFAAATGPALKVSVT